MREGTLLLSFFQQKVSVTMEKYIHHAFRVWAILTALYHMYTASSGTPQAYFQRPLHWMLVFVLLFYTRGSDGSRKSSISLIDVPWIIGVLAVGIFTVCRVDWMNERYPYISPLTIGEWIAAIALTLIVLEGARRTTGRALPITAAAFLLYGLTGPWMPGPLAHEGLTVESLLDVIYLSTDGIWGIPVYAASTYVVMFTIFGSFLMVSGVGQFFNDLAIAMTGRGKGGPAKTAVVASYLMGMISGGSATNVVTTGSFTIPLMKRVGYPAVFAGAVEAVASTGGQIMPPIMGVAAFLMAEFTGISYLQIIKHAIFPGLLYFFGIFMMVHFRSCRLDLMSEGEGGWRDVRRILLAKGHMVLPIFIMVWLLVRGYTAQATAFYGTLSTIAISYLNRDTRVNLRKILEALERGAKMVIPITSACACAGLIVGMVQISGLGVKISNIVIMVSGGKVIIALVLTMVVAVILGMGMPTSGAYIVMATLLAPALVKMQIAGASAEPITNVLTAHMFVFYFACTSSITPPVALASYAAAGLAEADPVRTSYEALRLGIGAYIVPYMFAFGPALLLIGTFGKVITALITAIAGVMALSGAMEGYFYAPMAFWQRALLFIGGVCLIAPFLWFSVIGLTLCLLAYGASRLSTADRVPNRL